MLVKLYDVCEVCKPYLCTKFHSHILAGSCCTHLDGRDQPEDDETTHAISMGMPRVTLHRDITYKTQTEIIRDARTQRFPSWVMLNVESMWNQKLLTVHRIVSYEIIGSVVVVINRWDVRRRRRCKRTILISSTINRQRNSKHQKYNFHCHQHDDNRARGATLSHVMTQQPQWFYVILNVSMLARHALLSHISVVKDAIFIIHLKRHIKHRCKCTELHQANSLRLMHLHNDRQHL